MLCVDHHANVLLFVAQMADRAPSVATEAVLKPSCELPEDMPKIKGYDFNQGIDLEALLKSYLTTGFQASSFSLAVQEINRMVRGAEWDFIAIGQGEKNVVVTVDNLYMSLTVFKNVRLADIK